LVKIRATLALSILVSLIWIAGLLLFVSSVGTKWQAGPQEIVYTTATVSSLESRTTAQVVEPTRFGFGTIPIDPKLSSGIRLESNIRYSVGGVLRNVTVDRSLYPGSSMFLKELPDRVDGMLISGTLYDIAGTGNSKFVIVDRFTGQELSSFQITKPGGALAFSYRFPTTNVVFTTTVFTSVTTIATTSESPIEISVVGTKWPTNWVFFGDPFLIKVEFNKYIAAGPGRYVANLTYVPPSGRSFTISNQSIDLPPPYGRREVQFPSSTSVIANETGNWDIFVKSQLFLRGGRQEIQKDLPVTVKLSSDIFWYEFLIALIGVPAAVIAVPAFFVGRGRKGFQNNSE